MKLAEALIIRGDIQTRISGLQERLVAAVLVQEGDKPDESPEALRREWQALNQELHRLILQIHRTNAEAIVPEKNQSLLAVLTERDRLNAEIRLLNQVLQQANATPARYSNKEIRWVKTIETAQWQKQLEALSAKMRDVNVLIQSTNWQVDLMEV